MKNFYMLFCCLFFSFSQGQTVYKYYVYLSNSTLAPTFIKNGNYVVYSGTNPGLQAFFSNYNIINFDRVAPSVSDEAVASILYLETESNTLAGDLVVNYPTTYLGNDNITDRNIELLYHPNDYGTTSPNINLGAPHRRTNLDYINVQKAWDNGRNGTGIIVGISDARVKLNDNDLTNVTLIGPNSQQSIPYNLGQINSWHGTYVASIAAGIGDNNYGSTGVCPKCEIVKTSYTGGNYINQNGINQNVDAFGALELLADAGARVINMSWTYVKQAYSPVPAEQTIINHLRGRGVVLVAAAGNTSSYQTDTDHECGQYANLRGIVYGFPASYDGVISVSSIGHQFPLKYPVTPANNPNTYCCTSDPPYQVENYIRVRDAISTVNGYDPQNLVGVIFNGYDLTCSPTERYTGTEGIQVRTTFNSYVDIVAPINDSFDYAIFAETGGITYGGGGTSSCAPQVAGTAALMLYVNQCLMPDEVENILKITSKDVEQLNFNQIFQGLIGAGSLDAGEAVTFVDEMKKANGNAIIQNHVFNRFNFSLQKINNNLIIQNAAFRDNNISDFKAKNQIRLLPNTNLKPNVTGSVHLSIDNAINVTCTPPGRYSGDGLNGNSIIEKSKIILYPNPNKGTFELALNNVVEFQNTTVKISVMDINGRTIYQQNVRTDLNNTFNIPLNIVGITDGLYLVNLSSGNYVETLKFVKR